ncbi:hepcidin isoform X2 [Oryzias latipes]|uniref:hepcidin isoform X2 n=1 Tax=Oryzias latipes TaxID=8090 RepID=UPI0009DB38F8|nr:hepcidin isoform X2 [Oryzias latipes]
MTSDLAVLTLIPVASHLAVNRRKRILSNICNHPKMKSFIVAVSLAGVLTCVCFQESSAVPVTEVHKLEGTLTDDSPPAADQKIPVTSWKTLYDIRKKRDSSAGCRICCSCFGFSHCEVCCPF